MATYFDYNNDDEEAYAARPSILSSAQLLERFELKEAPANGIELIQAFVDPDNHTYDGIIAWAESKDSPYQSFAYALKLLNSRFHLGFDCVSVGATKTSFTYDLAPTEPYQSIQILDDIIICPPYNEGDQQITIHLTKREP